MVDHTGNLQQSTVPACLQNVMPNLGQGQDAVVFKLGAEWCGACKRLDVYLDSVDGRRETASFALRRVDWDKDRGLYQCFADNQYVDLSTMTIPAFLVFDKSVRFAGYLSYDGQRSLAEQIRRQLDAVKIDEPGD